MTVTERSVEIVYKESVVTSVLGVSPRVERKVYMVWR
jgi:hypothetical protein